MASDFHLTAVLAADTRQFEAGLKSAAQETRQFQKEAAEIFRATRTPLENHRVAIEKVQDAWRTDRIDTDTMGRALHKLQKEFDATSTASKSAVSGLDEFKRLAASGLGAVGISLGAGAAIAELKAFLSSSLEEYHAAQQAQAKLAAVLESTGHAAGFTQDQLGVLANQLQRLTNYDDDAIASAQAVLATFREIQGVQFTQATEAILDVSAVLDQDLKSSAIQVGKALNDPIRGLTALRRVGVAFNAEQEEMIRNFVRNGELAKAQGVILQELSAEFGGAARKMRNELTGLKNDWGDLKETIGSFSDTDVARRNTARWAAQIRGLNNELAQAKEALAQFNAEQEATPKGVMAARELGNPIIAFLMSRFSAGAKEQADLEKLATKIRKDQDEQRRQQQALAKEAKQAAERSDLLEDLGKVNDELQKQAATFGMTANEVKIWELAQRGATEAELAEVKASAAAADQIHKAGEAAKARRTEAESLERALTAEIQSLRTEAQLTGKSADEQQRLRFALQGVSEARLKDLEIAQRQLDTARKQSDALREFYDMVENPATFNDLQAAENKKRDDMLQAIRERGKTDRQRAEEARDRQRAELESVKDFLSPAETAKELKRIDDEFKAAVKGMAGAGGASPFDALPKTSENRPPARGSAEAFSAANRSRDRAKLGKENEKNRREMLRIAREQLLEERRTNEALKNIKQWN